MTQEHIDLLTKDLSARLPYGVKVNADFIDFTRIGKLVSIGNNEELILSPNNGYPFDKKIEYCKPYLFPLSSMTEEQENEWNDLHLNPLGEILEDKFIGREKRLQLMFKSMVDPIQWCYKNHFDINGLIPMGLALKAPDGMYNQNI